MRWSFSYVLRRVSYMGWRSLNRRKTMRPSCRQKSKAVSIVLLIVISSSGLFGPREAYAFDTGHHSDLTRAAMQHYGFQKDAIKVVQVANWLTDFYSNHPNKFTGSRPKVSSYLNKLHFDNLTTPDELKKYWSRLVKNTRDSVQFATSQKDELMFLTVLGHSLHAVQDFYSHSNWVEEHPRAPNAPYRTVTWFSAPAADLERIVTGIYPDPASAPGPRRIHGNYVRGLNKDSYSREFGTDVVERVSWQDAYVFAYVATCEWLEAIRTWVMQTPCASPGDFWTRVQNYKFTSILNGGLAADLEAAYKTSLYVIDRDQLNKVDGHWKGSKGGDSGRFWQSYISWVGPQFILRSKLVNEVLEEYQISYKLSFDLYQNLYFADDVFPRPSTLVLRQTAVLLRTTDVQEFDTRPPRSGTPDFYSKISFDSNEPFIEAVQRTSRSITPPSLSIRPPWLTIHFVPNETASVRVRYELWDENTKEPNPTPNNTGNQIGNAVLDDTRRNINPAPIIPQINDLDFTFNIASRECTGLPNEATPTVHDEGSPYLVRWSTQPVTNGNRAVIRFFITTKPLVPR